MHSCLYSNSHTNTISKLSIQVLVKEYFSRKHSYDNEANNNIKFYWLGMKSTPLLEFLFKNTITEVPILIFEISQ